VKKRNRIAYFIALVLLFITSLPTIFDQFGLVDLGILVINIVPFIFLIEDRAWYLKAKPHPVAVN